MHQNESLQRAVVLSRKIQLHFHANSGGLLVTPKTLLGHTLFMSFNALVSGGLYIF